MRRAQDRARSARFRKNGARSATFKNSGARSATIESRALGALKLASEASRARSARWECARETGRFFLSVFVRKIFFLNLIQTNLLFESRKALQTNYFLTFNQIFFLSVIAFEKGVWICFYAFLFMYNFHFN